jgi:arginase
MPAPRLTLLGAPVDSVGAAGGTENGPAALRKGLPSVPDAGDIEGRLRSEARDPETGWVAWPQFLEMTAELRDRVSRMIVAGEVPVMLGGCCSVLPGAMAGVRRAGVDCGLVYFDGHLDLFTGETSPTGEAADMPVAALLGLAPEPLLDLTGPAPVVAPARMVLVGARDREELDLIAPLPDGLGIGRIELREGLNGRDLGEVGHSIAEEASTRGPFWVHLDVDILDRQAFPATDYLMDGGLDIEGLRELAGPALTSPDLAGMSIGCYNPDKDPDGSCGAELLDLLRETLFAGFP